MPDFFTGLFYFLAGFRLISQPGVRRFMLIPLAINIIFFIALFFLLRHFVSDFNSWVTQLLPAWLHWLSGVLWLIFLFSFFLIFVYFFMTIANFVAAPFNSFLAEKIEFQLTGKVAESRTLSENIRDIPRIFARQLAILRFYLPRAVGILILFFIPIVHFFAVVIWFIFNAWFLSLTYLDYPSDNQRISLETVKAWQQQHRMLNLGFGFGVLVASMIPGINFFTIPAAVAGATKLWIQNAKR